MDPKLSDVFKPTIFSWKVIGLWSDETSSKHFRLYSGLSVLLTSIMYFFFYSLSLLYTPRTVDIFASQALFYFTALSGIARIIVILMRRKQIISIFEIMDCKEFRGTDDKTNEYVEEFKTNYTKYYKAYATYCSASGYIFLIAVPLLNHLLRHAELKLPICDYYFLTDDIRNKFFFYLYLFQTAGLISTIMNNISCHTFLCGLIYMAITQFKILNWNIGNLKVDDGETSINIQEKEQKYLSKLNKCLKHYEIILKYCENLQSITDFLIFSQVGLAALTLCFCMYMFLLPLTKEDMVFMTCFTTVMLLENFVPSYLGSELTHESDNLRFAAYSQDWIPRSKSFKKSLMILIERAHRPVDITGLNMVTLSLRTFASIVKTAYSFFTLLRNTKE